MPAFIKTPQDEKRWADAKKAASKTLSESDGDSYWALTNSIYQKMNKSDEEALEKLAAILEKAREKIYDPNETAYEDESVAPEEQLREFDPDDEESSGEDWLKENDPEYQGDDKYEEYGDDEDEDAHQRGVEEDLGDVSEEAGEPATEAPQEGEEPTDRPGSASQAQEQKVTKVPIGQSGLPQKSNRVASQIFGFDDLGKVKGAKSIDDAKKHAHALVDRQDKVMPSNKLNAKKMIDNAKSIDDLMTGMYNFSEKYSGGTNRELAARNKAGTGPTDLSEDKEHTSRFRQPSRDELVGMRNYTRPWEQRARETNMLQADPSKNPELAHQGNIVEARNQAHADRKSSYNQMINSDDYKKADPISQMEMDDKFESDWRAKNPEHLKGAMKAHHEADLKGQEGKKLHAAEKDAKIQNVLTGGTHNPDAYSTEEGLQHAGGIRGEEGTEGSIKHDPASSFAMGNQDFIRHYAQEREKKGKRPSSVEEMGNYDEGAKRDIGRILGPQQAKDPKFEKFFEHYHPLIGMSAGRTIKRLGLDPKSPELDMSMLHEAGMHGLIQAINDYNHDNPSKASFATHAGNKIRGLQMTAMRNQDAIPAELRQAQKKFQTGKAAGVIKQSGHSKANDMHEMYNRVLAQRKTHEAKQAAKPPVATPQAAPAPAAKPMAPKTVVRKPTGESK